MFLISQLVITKKEHVWHFKNDKISKNKVTK